MALTSATTAAATVSSPSRIIRRFASSPDSRAPSSLLRLAPRRGAENSPRACSWHRLVVVRRMDGRARALLGGLSDAGGSESDEEEEEEEEHALRGGQREGEVDDAVALSSAAVGPERWDVLGLGQAMVRATLVFSPLSPLRESSCKIVFRVDSLRCSSSPADRTSEPKEIEC